jgi:hypothetical protein
MPKLQLTTSAPFRQTINLPYYDSGLPVFLPYHILKKLMIK